MCVVHGVKKRFKNDRKKKTALARSDGALALSNLAVCPHQCPSSPTVFVYSVLLSAAGVNVVFITKTNQSTFAPRLFWILFSKCCRIAVKLF